jgi:hypothetical protein
MLHGVVSFVSMKPFVCLRGGTDTENKVLRRIFRPKDGELKKIVARNFVACVVSTRRQTDGNENGLDLYREFLDDALQ